MHHVMSNRFWVYWAIALPQTLVVMGTVTAFAMYQSQKKGKEMEKARDNADLAEV